MPSLLRKVQDAQQFLAHYPSFFIFALAQSKSKNKKNRSQTSLYTGTIMVVWFALILIASSQSQAESVPLSKGGIKLRQTFDPNSIEQKKAFEEKLRGAAQLYERQFLNEMVKSMRATIQHSQFSQPSMAENIYRDKMFDEYVSNWSKKGGVGFSEEIYKQLIERYSPYHKKAQMPPNNKVVEQNLLNSKPLALKENKKELTFVESEVKSGSE